MSSLTHLEKRYLEKLFDMQTGYVMGPETFSDRTYAEFFRDTIKVNIDDPKYGCESKAKRLRKFWSAESDTVVGKVLDELLRIWVHNQPDKTKAMEDTHYLEARKTVDRLVGRKSTTEFTEEDFLSKDFGKINLKKLNVEPSLLPVLESRLNEIQICIKSGAPVSTVIMAGSMLEGLLLSAAITSSSEFMQSTCSPKDKTGKVRPIKDWSLSSFIDVAHDVGLLGLDIKKHSHALRDFRNFIHPYEHMNAKFTPDIHTAKIGMQVLLAAIADLSGQRSNP